MLSFKALQSRRKGLIPVALTLILFSYWSSTAWSRTIVLGLSDEMEFQSELDSIYKLIDEKIPELEIKLKRLPLARSLLEANNGKIDGDGGRIGTIKEIYPGSLENLIQLNEAVLQVGFYCLRRKNELVSIELDKIGNRKISFLNGIGYLQRLIPAINQVRVAEQDQGLRLVSDRRADAYILIARSYEKAKKLARKHKLEVDADALAFANIYPLLHKTSADLIPAFERAIRSLRQEGKLEALQFTSFK